MADEKDTKKEEVKPQGEKSGGSWFGRHKGLTIGGVIVAVIVAIIALGGGNASFNFSVGGPSAECKYEDKNLCKFLNKLTETDEVSMKIAGDADGTLQESTIKIQGADKTQVTTSTNGTELNIITMGNTIYAKQADGSWSKYVDEKGELNTGSNTDWKGNLEKSLNETSTVKYEKLGEEKCGDLNCIKYKMTDSSDSTLDTTLYFDDKKFLLRKATSDVEGSATEVTYSYDDVNISEPAGAKTVNSAAELYGGIGLQN